jgi:hypothetical protein
MGESDPAHPRRQIARSSGSRSMIGRYVGEADFR